MYYLTPFRNSEVFDHTMEGLIKAGYKGNLSDYYQIIEENKLSGNEIKELILNKKVSGKIYGVVWFQSKSDEGNFEYVHHYGRTHKGKSWVDGDTLCYQFESLYDGIEYCAEIYNNPAGNKKELSEYLSLTDFWIYPFSIME
jgi:hypothetical protein